MKILVVDDDQSMRDMFTDMFTTLGHEVVTAKDGVEGISVYRQRFLTDEFDLVLSDNQMPRMGGVPMLMEIRAMNPTQKMAMASGDPPKMPPELADVLVLLKGSVRLKDIEGLLQK